MQAQDTSRSLRVVGYCRVSRDEQERSGLGLEAQRQAIVAEVERRGWQLVELVEEVASGGKTDRPGLAHAVSLVERGQASGLIVSKLDRLSRSVVHFAGLLERFRAAGWGLVVLDLGVDTTTIAGEAMANVMATFAQMERRRIGERTREALDAARKRGVKLGRPRELDETTRQRIIAMRRQGMSYRAIASTLEQDGTPTARQGSRWHPETIRAIVTAAGRSPKAQ
jgi:DNA invertase Pin-like site-specific DNA recombinase